MADIPGDIPPEYSNAIEALKTAARLRVPRRGELLSRGVHFEKLADYMLESAEWQGALEEHRLQTHDALRELNDEWDKMVGWENYRSGRTDKSVDEAKAKMDPRLAEAKKNAEWLIRRLSEQIDRLERDATKCSRAYTLLGGQ